MKAYYAVDHCSTTTVLEGLSHHFKSSTDSDSAHIFALVDFAFDHGSRAMAWASPLVPLYSEGRLARLATVSPVLAILETNNEETLVRQVRRLVHHASGRPMLSFVQTNLSAESLNAHWQAFLNAETEDGQSYLLRWGDTRVLPALARSLTPDTWASITQPMHAWMFVNRQGHLEGLRLPHKESQPSHPVDHIKLSASALDLLLKEGEPDAVIQALHETLPHLLPKIDRAAFYDRIAACCRLAANHGMEAFPDVLSLATAACLSKGGVQGDPRITEILITGDWQPGKFADRLMELMPPETE